MKSKLLTVLFGVILLMPCVSCKKEEPTIISVDFGEGKYKEPFRGFLSSHPQWLVATLDWPVLRSLRPDTLVLTKTIELEFNEDAVRSHSEAVIQFVDDSCHRLEGVKVYCNDLPISKEGFRIKASSEPQLVKIAYKIDPLKKKCTETGLFIVSGVELDEVNKVKLYSEAPQSVADWTLSQEIGCPWLLWLVWLIMALIIIVIIVSFIVFIVKGIGIIIKSVSMPNPVPASFGSRNGGGLPQNRRIPKNEGHWTGEPGNSKWIPAPNYHPHKGIYSNMDDKTWEQILKENNIDGIDFKNGEPNFNNVAKYETSVDYNSLSDKIKEQLLSEKRERSGLHDYVYDKIAKEQGLTREELIEIKERLNLVAHETSDGRVLLVPREIHDNIIHEGGVALFRALFS